MIDSNLVYVGLEANNYVEVLDAMAKKLFEEGYVFETYIDAVKRREEEFPTGLPISDNYAIAIPHADKEHVKKIGAVIATLKKPIPFKIMGGEDEDYTDVSLVIMLAIDDPKEHMAMLAKLMDLFSDEEKLEKIKISKSKEEIMSILDF